MARRIQYTDEMILDAAKRVKAAGKNLNPWAVRTELGGGKPNRIEQVLNNPEYALQVIDAEPVAEQELLTLPSQFSSQVQQIQEAMHNAACEMWRTASEMADNRVKDEFLSAKKAKETAEFELAEAREAVDRQEDELDTLDAELDGIKKVCSQRESELKDAGRQIAASEAEIKSLKSQLAELRNENKQLEKELETEQQAVSEMRGELKAKEQQLSGISKENGKLSDKNNKLQEGLTAAAKEETRLKLSLDHAASENKALMTKAAEKNSKITTLENRIHEQQEELSEMTRCKADLSALRKRFSDLFKESDSLKEENKSLLKQVGGLETELKSK